MNRCLLVLLLLIFSTSVFSKQKELDSFELHAITSHGIKLKWVFYNDNQLFSNPTYPVLYNNLIIESNGRWGVYDKNTDKVRYIRPIH